MTLGFCLRMEDLLIFLLPEPDEELLDPVDEDGETGSPETGSTMSAVKATASSICLVVPSESESVRANLTPAYFLIRPCNGNESEGELMECLREDEERESSERECSTLST